MKILFVADYSCSKRSSFVRLRKLIKVLENTGYKVREVLLKSHHDSEHHLTTSDHLCGINESEWELVLLYGGRSIQVLSERIKVTPIIFISDSNEMHDQCINLPNLYRILVISNKSNPLAWGFASEFWEVIQIPSVNSQKSANQISDKIQNQYQLIYFTSEDDNTLRVSRAIINTVNYLSYASLTVVALPDVIPLLQDCANSHIQFLTTAPSVNGFDLILASGEQACAAALENVPVVVIGNKGLGGLITSDNVNDFIKTDFNGRIGGTWNEETPRQLLEFEIKCALGIEEDSRSYSLDKQSVAKLTKYYNNKWQDRILCVIKATVLLSKYVSDKTLVTELIPSLSVYITLQKLASGETALFNNLNGKLIGTMGADETSIIHSCKGEFSIGTISKQNPGTTLEEIISFITILWQSKVLILNVPSNK